MWGWPLAMARMAHVGQPVQGPLGVVTCDKRYREVVEVAARTGQYQAGRHRSGVPEDFAQYPLEEREQRGRLLRQRREKERIAYLYISYLGWDNPDSLDRVYRDHQQDGIGMAYLVPPPKPLRAQRQVPEQDVAGSAGGPGAVAPTTAAPPAQAAAGSPQKPTALPNLLRDPTQSRTSFDDLQPVPEGGDENAAAKEEMYDPENPTNTWASETPGPGSDEDALGHVDNAPDPTQWEKTPFRSQLHMWGLDEVEGRQDNKDRRCGQCFLVAVREALIAEGRG